MLSAQMTSADVNKGMRVTITVARRLLHDLGRYPTSTEIQWRTATQFQARNPRRGPPLTRHDAMALALQMMEAVKAASERTTQ